MSRPLVIELFCGRFGWSRGFTAEGFQAVGFDIVHEDYHGEIPEGCELVLQDVLTLHGSQFRDAAAIVASPPCQAYSYRAMPWKKAKALPPPSNDLFDACFRIQREAIEAAGRHIPMVVENVKGAQPWVGRAAWHYGSYYLWGDVPALMPFAGKHRKGAEPIGPTSGGNATGATSWFGTSRADPRDMRRNEDGEYTRMGLKSEAVKVSGLNWSNHGKPGFKAQGFNVTAAQRYRDREEQGIKQKGSGAAWFDKALDERRKAAGAATKNGGDWFGSGADCSLQRKASSRSRKAASAAIAEIPYDLSNWVARCLKP